MKNSLQLRPLSGHPKLLMWRIQRGNRTRYRRRDMKWKIVWSTRFPVFWQQVSRDWSFQQLLKPSCKNKKAPSQKTTALSISEPMVVPYVQQLYHNLEKVADRHHVPFALSAPNNLSRLRGEAWHRLRKLRYGRGTQHPPSMGASYTGQTGRCIFDRLQERANNVESYDTTANLVLHFVSCVSKCRTRMENTKIQAMSFNGERLSFC